MLTRLRELTEAETDLGLLHKLRRIVRHKLVFVGAIVATVAVALGLSRLQGHSYSASALLLFRDTNTTPAFLGVANQSAPIDPAQQSATDLRLANLPRIARLVAARVPGVSARTIAAETTVAPQGQSDVVGVTVTDPSPHRAAALATAYAQQAIAVRRQSDQASLLQALTLVQASYRRLSPADRRGGFGRQLQSEANQLSILASLQTGQAQLVQAAPIPSAPSSPGSSVFVAVGLLAGIALGYALVTLLDRVDRRVHNLDELTALVSCPVMGFVPRGLRPELDRDAFNLIRTNLRYVPTSPVTSVLISSSEPVEGKTTLAWNLAASAAAAGMRTLLIEADLRQPSIARVHRLPAQTGLSEALAGLLRWQDAVTGTGARADGGDGFDVLAAGRIPSNPTELLASDSMPELLTQAAGEYGLVVIDSAPLGVVPDAVPLAAACDATLVVARLKRVRRDHVTALISRLQEVGAPVVGIVANYCERAPGYSYGYGHPRPRAAAAAAPQVVPHGRLETPVNSRNL